jgi:hypothetical protein
MLPLGDVWTGICQASTDAAIPGDSVLMPLCNMGYARGNCQRFPDAGGPDAVRFTISKDEGPFVHLYYVLERNHHPFAHGPLAFDPATDQWVDPPAGDGLRMQARAYLASYLRRKSEAPAH